jgi:nucleoside-diphosphate-sugar epimerase
MATKKVFITGASGCIGHYLIEHLIQETDWELYLLIRNPEQLKFERSATDRSSPTIIIRIDKYRHFSCYCLGWCG